MNFVGFEQWHKNFENKKHLIIAGPCSAETHKQVYDTAAGISRIKEVDVFRAGIWKPRTSPGTFEGIGEKGLKWLSEVKRDFNLPVCTEVATPDHVEKALKSQAIDIFWIGARTTANPFSVQAIADALKGVDIPVMVKNPVNPDLKLWIGAIERIYNAGINKIAAIHRGFYPFEDTRFRNIPKWELLIELKTQIPELPVINDPSHIAGKRNLLEEVIRMALCMNVDGFMIETHINPQKALSDAEQQVTPERLSRILQNVNFRKDNPQNTKIITELEHFRHGIDSIDYQLLELLAKRMELVEKIGRYKDRNNISIFQLNRWREIIKSRLKAGKELNLNIDFVKKILQLVHNESIEIQAKISKK